MANNQQYRKSYTLSYHRIQDGNLGPKRRCIYNEEFVFLFIAMLESTWQFPLPILQYFFMLALVYVPQGSTRLPITFPIDCLLVLYMPRIEWHFSPTDISGVHYTVWVHEMLSMICEMFHKSNSVLFNHHQSWVECNT